MKNLYNDFNESLNYLNLKKRNENKGKSLKKYTLLYAQFCKNLVDTKKENYILKSKLNELQLFIKKMKNDFSIKIKKLKEKLEKMNNEYISYTTQLESKINNIDKNNINEPIYINTKKISELNKENDRINNINHNLSEELLNKEEIINRLRDDNNKLNNKLNFLRTNPNNENNMNFYNSFSTKENIINPRNLFPKNNIKNDNYADLNQNAKTILNNNNYHDYFNEGFYEISHKYFTNKKSDTKIFKNMLDYKFNNNNYNIEYNSSPDNYMKSKSFNKSNYINLKIQIQDNFPIYSKAILINKNSNNFYSEKINPSWINNTNEKNILSIIKKFSLEIKKDYFQSMINKIFNSNNMILILNNKIGEIKNNLFIIKEKFINNNNNKKIKPNQLLDIINEIEKLLFYLFNQLNKYNIDTQKITPFLKSIFNIVSLITFNIPLEINDNIKNIITFTNDSNKKSYINDNFKDNILLNNNNNKQSEENYFQNFNSLFYINNKIFSSSELIKYHSIYQNLKTSELISVFKEICDNFKNVIFNSKFNYDSDFSDFEENNQIKKIKDNEVITENNTYHVVNEKIFSLKKFEFNFKLFFELVKNYLIIFELIVKKIEINIENEQMKKELEKKLNILYDILEESSYLNINNLDDNAIFCRKILLTLLFNQKINLSHLIKKSSEIMN